MKEAEGLPKKPVDRCCYTVSESRWLGWWSNRWIAGGGGRQTIPSSHPRSPWRRRFLAVQNAVLWDRPNKPFWFMLGISYKTTNLLKLSTAKDLPLQREMTKVAFAWTSWRTIGLPPWRLAKSCCRSAIYSSNPIRKTHWCRRLHTFYKKDRKQHDKTAQEWVQKYALWAPCFRMAIS